MSYQKFGYSYEYFHSMCPVNTNRNMCSECGEFFNSTAAFDKHRIEDKTAKYGRRCMDTTEMYGKGMAKKESGHWVTEIMRDLPFPATVGGTSLETEG